MVARNKKFTQKFKGKHLKMRDVWGPWWQGGKWVLLAQTKDSCGLLHER